MVLPFLRFDIKCIYRNVTVSRSARTSETAAGLVVTTNFIKRLPQPVSIFHQAVYNFIKRYAFWSTLSEPFLSSALLFIKRCAHVLLLVSSSGLPRCRFHQAVCRRIWWNPPKLRVKLCRDISTTTGSTRHIF